MHSVVAETNEEGQWWVFDPNQGREDGRLYYVAGNAEGDLQFNILSYFLIYEFDRDYIESRFYE